MSNELKPCPFCGGKAISLKDKYYHIYSVACTECDAGTNTYGVEQAAIYAWNNRVLPPFTPDELDAIRRMFRDRYPRARELPKIEQAIIDKCDAVLKGTGNE